MQKSSAILAALLISTTPSYSGLASLSEIHEAIDTLVLDWNGSGASFDHFMQDYRPLNDYLNYGTSNPCREIESRLTFDEAGTALQYSPVVEQYQFAPVMAAQCGLKAFGAGDFETMSAQVEGLLEWQNEIGGFADEAPYRYYLAEGGVIEAGGLSGMSQGQALSLLARAYSVTRDPRILHAGRQEARELFQRGTDTLRRVLPLYDFGRLSSYDLAHITHERTISR